MAPVGMSNGINRFGVSGPVNSSAPAGSKGITGDPGVQWYEAGPVWVLIFLVVGYILVRQTLRG